MNKKEIEKEYKKVSKLKSTTNHIILRVNQLFQIKNMTI